MVGRRAGRSRRRAFTLIELLVVIAVIAILAAIIFPVFHSAQERARQAQCLANLSSISVAMKLYRNQYKRYPLGSVTGNSDNLPDEAGNNAFTSPDYNTVDAANGRRSRICALYPSFLDDQKTMICPDEGGSDGEAELALLSGNPDTGLINGQDPDTVLVVGGDGSAGSYDDMYNVFGFAAGNTGTVSLGPGTPITTVAGQVGGGRKAPRLSNPYAPNTTIITYCREHEYFFDAGSEIVLACRVGGETDRLTRHQYNWTSQPAQAY